MPLTASITIFLIVIGIWLLLRKIPSYGLFVSDFFVLTLFLFAYPNIEGGKNLSIFYLIAMLISLVTDIILPQINFDVPKSVKAMGTKFSGLSLTLMNLAIGTAIYFFINLSSTRTGSVIIGVPTISVVSELSEMMNPVYSAILGIIENRFFFTVFHILHSFGALIPFLGILFQAMSPVGAILLSSLVFGVFHLSAYSIAVGAIIWAAVAFGFFLVSYLITQDTLAADWAHILHNGTIALGRTMRIVI